MNKKQKVVAWVAVIAWGMLCFCLAGLIFDTPCPPAPAVSREDVPAAYRMPPGEWVTVGVWTSCRTEKDTTTWSHYGCFYFYDNRLWSPPDSVYVPMKCEENK